MPFLTQPRSTSLPNNACDCHMHVFDKSYPTAKGATLRPADASLENYGIVQRSLGFERHVLVQPSTYGIDNSLLLHALKSRSSIARGIAVVDSSVSDKSLSILENAGVVGIRFNQVQIGATTMRMFDALASRVKELSWHIQLHLTTSELIEEESRLAKSPTPIVLDHFARIQADPVLSTAAFQTVERLLSNGNTWLKLSAPYLATLGECEELDDITSALIQKYSNRLVWGTDWPHATEIKKPNDFQAMEWLRKLINNPDTEQAIFSRNPSLLYHFDE